MAVGAAQAGLEVAIQLLKAVGLRVAIKLLRAYLRRRSRRRRAPPPKLGGAAEDRDTDPSGVSVESDVD